MRVCNPRVAAYLVAIVVAGAFSYDLMRVPVQASDSLGEILNAQQSPSVIASFAGSFGDTAYLRPLRIAQIKALFDLAHGHYWLVYRGFHALLLIAAVLLFVRALDVRTWTDVAAAVFALTVLTGLHTFRGTVREAFPINHFLEIVVLCLLAVNLARSRGGLWVVRLEFPIFSLHPGLRPRGVAPDVWPTLSRDGRRPSPGLHPRGARLDQQLMVQELRELDARAGLDPCQCAPFFGRGIGPQHHVRSRLAAKHRQQAGRHDLRHGYWGAAARSRAGGRLKRTFSVMPSIVEICNSANSRSFSIRSCTNSSGVEAPAVMPTLFFARNQAGSSFDGSCASRIPNSLAASRIGGTVAWRLASGLRQRGTQPRVVEGPHAVDLRRRPHGCDLPGFFGPLITGE